MIDCLVKLAASAYDPDAAERADLIKGMIFEHLEQASAAPPEAGYSFSCTCSQTWFSLHALLMCPACS